jgi:hypothetical protein
MEPLEDAQEDLHATDLLKQETEWGKLFSQLLSGVESEGEGYLFPFQVT